MSTTRLGAGLGGLVVGGLGMFAILRRDEGKGRARGTTIVLTGHGDDCQATVKGKVRLNRRQGPGADRDDADFAVWRIRDKDGCLTGGFDRVQLRFFKKQQGTTKSEPAEPLTPRYPEGEKYITADINFAHAENRKYFYEIWLTSSSGAATPKKVGDPELVIEP